MEKPEDMKRAMFSAVGMDMPKRKNPVSALREMPPDGDAEAPPAEMPAEDPVAAVYPQLEEILGNTSVSPAIKSAVAELLTAIKAEKTAQEAPAMA